MGLLRDLGYRGKTPNRVQRVVQRLASSRPGAWLFSKTLYPIDKALFTMTGGRWTLSNLAAGIPVVMLTTTGAKSGKPRTMPLLGIPTGEDLAIIGTNYEQEATAGWVYNLETNPSATLSYRDRTVAVTTRRADNDETERVFDLAPGIYFGYGHYRTRADHRTIRVFIVESTV